MNIISIFSILFMILGVLFKLNHWPGTAIMMILSQFFLCFFFLPTLYIFKRNSFDGWKGRFLNGLGLFCLSFFMLAVLAKIMHWPGANPMIVLSMVFFSVIFLPSFCIQRIRKALNRNEKRMILFVTISLAFATLGIMFKLLHWPFSAILLATGSIFFLFFFLPFFILTYSNVSGERTDKLIRLFFYTTGVSIIISLTMGNSSNGLFASFTVIENSILELTSNIEVSNNMTVSSFKPTDSNTNVVSKMKKVKELSDNLNDYILELRSFIIMSSDKIPKEVSDSLKLNDVASKDNYDIPTYILIGGDPQHLTDGAYSARELKNKLAVYRMDLLSFLKSSDRYVIEKRIGLQTNDQFDPEIEQLVSWEYSNFYHLPLCSIITELSSIQANVRYAESEIIQFLAQNNSEKSIEEPAE